MVNDMRKIPSEKIAKIRKKNLNFFRKEKIRKIRVAMIKYIGGACSIFPAKIPETQIIAGKTIGLGGDLGIFINFLTRINLNKIQH